MTDREIEQNIKGWIKKGNWPEPFTVTVIESLEALLRTIEGLDEDVKVLTGARETEMDICDKLEKERDELRVENEQLKIRVELGGGNND